MKKTKVLALFLVLVLSFSMVACGASKSDIKDALQGSWVAKWTMMGKQITRYYTFKGDTYTTGGVTYLGKLDPETGTYKITNEFIVLTPDDGGKSNDLEYTYNKKTGEIVLWWNEDVQFEKGNVDINYW